MDGQIAKRVTVVVGVMGRNAEREHHKTVRELVKHPHHDRYHADIGAVILSESLTFTNDVKTIKLPGFEEFSPVGRRGTIAGW